jgi:hypothetical protein
MKPKRLAPIVLSLAILLAPGVAAADEAPSAGMKALDVALVRPVSMLLSFASLGVFLGISPLTTFMGIGEETADVMVVAPWRYTSAREIGSFDRYRDGGDLFDRLDREARRVRY